MCLVCWKRDCRPYNATERAKGLAPLFAATDPCGAMHIVVEDWNLEDENIRSAMAMSDTTPSDIALGKALLQMTMEERWATAILADDPGFDPTAEAA